MKVRKRLTNEEANLLKLKIRVKKGKSNPQYPISADELEIIENFRNSFEVGTKTETKTNEYKSKFVLSAWNMKTGQMMDIDNYCSHYSLPRADISSYKLVSHTGTPYYNIAFKENILESGIDFESILSKYENFTPSEKVVYNSVLTDPDFDMLTYTDVHIGMDTDSTGNAMYADDWSEKSIKESYYKMIDATISSKESDTIIVDELGDFLDGFNGYTTRGGHKLPQLMTNEEAFDVALEFKVDVVDRLAAVYKNVVINNICNDNHAGSFGYFVNSALKNLCDRVFDNVSVVNYRQFINHYFVNDICFIITHGKDDSTLKFGFKPQLDSKGLEKIDQYCKQNDLYKKAKKIIFKKGDSHQCLFDMCTSDDFYYFNYPALSPSSQWVQNNFKKGRRGYVLEKWTAGSVEIDPFFF
mgnify:CR=1 FL=1